MWSNNISETKPLLRLSQSSLKLLETCPRKFQNSYLEQLNFPNHPENLQKQLLGTRFHQIMQQRELGLPVEHLLASEPQLSIWLNNLLQTAPEILNPQPNTQRYSEHSRSFELGDYYLLVVYDLLITEENKAKIIDWKTYPEPKQKKWLLNDWQTCLYPFVLAETSDYLPEQISMTYWFVQSSEKPSSITFPYSSQQHEKTKQDLNNILERLSHYLQDYYQGIPFPQTPIPQQHCSQCNYQGSCQKNAFPASLQADQELLLDLATVPEIFI